MMKARNYYIYHIPGKKIGVTTNVHRRVTLMQGYQEGEYEILETSPDIDYISNKELELQKEYGYKVDRQLYKNLKHLKRNQMKLNVTEMTTTFPVPVSKLKGRLFNMLDRSFDMNGTEVTLTPEVCEWIIKNVVTSMYNNTRCYIYNKALQEYMNDLATGDEPILTESVFNNIRRWALERGIYDKGDAKTQYIKLMEEAGELAQALLKNDEKEIVDAIGDMVVVLTNLTTLATDIRIEDCIDAAYDEIKNRKGQMKNGTFVKQTL